MMAGGRKAGGSIIALSRRSMLSSGSAAGLLLLPAAAGAQRSTAIIRRYAAPRQIRNVDHQVVYRRDTEMVGWPHVMGFWNLGDGEILQQVTSINTRYPSASAISHDNLGSEGLGGKSVALRSKDWGRTWDGAKPVFNMMTNQDQSMAAAKTMGDLQPINFLDRNILIANNGTAFGMANGKT
jgi:hypothetical protein